MNRKQTSAAAVTPRKFNPGFLTDDELVETFCVRTAEFESLIESIRECTTSANQHQLVIGPRGSGKTSLLLRVAAELRMDPVLCTRFFPVVFAEESYEVATAGEFWLEAVYRIAHRPEPWGDATRLDRSYEELRAERNDNVLAERCLGTLLDFADQIDRRLVLVVENLNMLLAEIPDEQVGWQIRKTLQTEPRLILLASATSRFDAIDDPEEALYGFLRVTQLERLNTGQCAALWRSVAGREASHATIRSLEILTGGSPRLLTIVARFGADLSFRELMGDLLELVDEHTEYFKSHLEALPRQERRVYLALADLWRPATTREIADRARIETSKCSAQLNRLEGRGVVSLVGGTQRRKEYYLSERLYNIYYLLRRHSGMDRVVEALISFMTAFYSGEDLIDIGARIAAEAQQLAPRERARHVLALERLVASTSPGSARERLLERMPEALRGSISRTTRAELPVASEPGVRDGSAAHVDAGSQPRSLEVIDHELLGFQLAGQPAEPVALAKLLGERAAALVAAGHMDEALEACDAVVTRFGEREGTAIAEQVARALVNKGIALGRLDRADGELEAYDAVVARFGEREETALAVQVARALINKGVALSQLDRADGELEAYDAVVARFGEREETALAVQVARALINKGVALGQLDRADEELEAYDAVVTRFGEREETALAEQVARALINKGVALGQLDRADEELEAYDAVVARFGEREETALAVQVARALINKGVALGQLDRADGALEAYDAVVTRFGEREETALAERVAWALVNKGIALGQLDRADDALEACDAVVTRFGERKETALAVQVAWALINKGVALSQLDRVDEALEAYDAVVTRFGEREETALAVQMARALVNKGVALGQLDRADDAIDAASRALEVSPSPATAVAALRTRGLAYVASGEIVSGTEDMASMLEMGVDREDLLSPVVDALLEFTVAIGPEPVLSWIVQRGDEELLLPLAAALRLEIGEEPRVAREVMEVAEDIRARIEQIRDREERRGR